MRRKDGETSGKRSFETVPDTEAVDGVYVCVGRKR